MNASERLRATYKFEPVDHLCRREFYIWDEAIERWKTEGLADDIDRGELFGFDEAATVEVGMLGWCSPPFIPPLEEKVLESREEYELVRDDAGRTVKYFKGRRHGFMPEYIQHAVTCERDWEEDVAALLSPDTPQRWEGFDEKITELKCADAKGLLITQNAIGGYMFLRALVGPEGICYMFMDNPLLVHRMMQAWLELADAVTSRIQQHVEIDQLFLAEDVCYNHGLLISPGMVREFIFPYYQHLRDKLRSRQTTKRLFIQIDTDGNVGEAIDLYAEGAGMNVMCPFEVAAGNDVIEIARKHQDLIMTGGIDKRVLAAGREAIDEYLGRVLPFMVKRGGYVPTCDHGVPDNVSFDNYMHYRKRVMELDH